jgi:hypothetical protein
MRFVLFKLNAMVIIVIALFGPIQLADAIVDDENKREVGVEWVNDYSGARSAGYQYIDLTNADDDAVGFYNYLGQNSFTIRFSYGDSVAWESDFERPEVGGYDNLYVYNVDIVYFSGHGGQYAFWFGVNHDGDGEYQFRVNCNEAYWGDNCDLEWIFISACLVLNEATYTNWGGVFGDVHGICSFHTESYDCPDLGYWMAYYATDGGYSTGDAWRLATRRVQPSNVWSAIYRALIRIDTFIVDYYNEPLGVSWVDYGEQLVYLYTKGYERWSC